MSYEEKKEYILNSELYKDFFEETDYNYFFRLDVFKDVITQMKDEDVKSDEIISSNNELTTKKFLLLLRYLVTKVKSYLINVLEDDESIYSSSVFLFNNDLIKDYFLNTWFDLDIIDTKIHRIIIAPFIYNTRYIKELRLFLEDNNIELKDINEYSDEECLIIIQLLLNLSLCASERYKSCVFFNIDEFFVDNDYEVSTFYNNDLSYYKVCTISTYQNYYKIIFDEYNKKKKYIKYFSLKFDD